MFDGCIVYAIVRRYAAYQMSDGILTAPYTLGHLRDTENLDSVSEPPKLPIMSKKILTFSLRGWLPLP